VKAGGGDKGAGAGGGGAAARKNALLSPNSAVKSSTAPDVSDDLADLLMRRGFYHYAFTFALFEVNTVEKALVLNVDKLKGMSIPEKDAVAMAAAFAKTKAEQQQQRK
jgi:hypothetical protein